MNKFLDYIGYTGFNLESILSSLVSLGILSMFIVVIGGMALDLVYKLTIKSILEELELANILYICNDERCNLISRKYQTNFYDGKCPHCYHKEDYESEVVSIWSKIETEEELEGLDLFFAKPLTFKSYFKYRSNLINYNKNKNKLQKHKSKIYTKELTLEQIDKYKANVEKEIIELEREVQ